jgi:hypothetical protein
VDNVRESPQEVISYDDDVYVWVYLDQVDRVLRYEAYVIDYDDHGRPSTLKMVVEEGVLDNIHEVELFRTLLQQYCARYEFARVPLRQAFGFTADGQLVSAPSLMHFYSSLSAAELADVHRYFLAQEAALKRDKKARWIRMLRALGYDVISSLT